MGGGSMLLPIPEMLSIGFDSISRPECRCLRTLTLSGQSMLPVSVLTGSRGLMRTITSTFNLSISSVMRSSPPGMIRTAPSVGMSTWSTSLSTGEMITWTVKTAVRSLYVGRPPTPITPLSRILEISGFLPSAIQDGGCLLFRRSRTVAPEEGVETVVAKGVGEGEVPLQEGGGPVDQLVVPLRVGEGDPLRPGEAGEGVALTPQVPEAGARGQVVDRGIRGGGRDRRGGVW
uniref:Uncharacterized protein n=1 Tax=Chromera velia CCMP2878 TaxID=1169474 RepID=A0A0G4F553_9ALVE|eukprot:Cvel_2723.t1-p1 / transcript=Cvel_2723.t1 / gene=Cvel_2723 / organism=Chromera_velia_CCMP2878 / gene_product=hypothetical protein / transcript_product=hypothetical protein / location=Cvel_scaffold109:37724-38416(+) / protein_length=231 / sequence_SO=supercontig / SO=protein_coding / is_pseudo=false